MNLVCDLALAVHLDPDWPTIRDVLLVVGPLAAAAVITWQAILTRRSTEAAERTAEAAESQAKATTRPLMIDAPVGPYTEPGVEDEARYPDGVVTKFSRLGTVSVGIDAEEGGTCRCSLSLRNVGRGLAVITDARLYAAVPIRHGEALAPRTSTAFGPDRERFFPLRGRYPEITKPNLPAGEETRISFAFPAQDASLIDETEARDNRDEQGSLAPVRGEPTLVRQCGQGAPRPRRGPRSRRAVGVGRSAARYCAGDVGGERGGGHSRCGQDV